jgi:NAD(P)-dependent dehydrogenase (short-subunit alcohol dehydrogenase family)
MKIEGSVALVTGANRGLGRALVTALIEAGATKVYAAMRRKADIDTHGGRVVPLLLDTSDDEQVAAAARVASDVTLLVNNAGVMTSWSVLTASRADIDADFGTNVHGMLAVVRAFVPVLERARGGATITNVLSLSSLASFPPLGGYAASKAAAYSVTQALRAELKPKHIDVLAVLPGPIDTEMVSALPIAKTSAADTARGIVAGIVRGDEEIFPDPVAQQLSAVWNSNPKQLERALAEY